MEIINKFEKFIKKNYFWFLGFLIVLTLIVRFYKLDQVPLGLYQDETAIGYNAYLITETGKDEYGKPFPLYFKSFGDYKLPVYIYSVALFVKLFGLNEFAVRLPSAIAGFTAIILLFFILKKLTKNLSLSFFSSVLLAINPWHLQFSRAGFEVNLALTFCLLGTWFFINAISKKKKLFFVLTITSFFMALYSYNVTRMLAPILGLLLTIIYWKKLDFLKKRDYFLLTVYCLLLSLPFVLSFFSLGGISSAGFSLISGPDVLARNVEFRSYLLQLNPVYIKLFFNRFVYMCYQYLQNLVLGLSPNFFFVNGTDQPNQGIGNVGAFYLFQFPLFLFGLIDYFKNKRKEFRFFYFWLIISYLILSLSKDVPHATRGFFLVIPVTIFSGVGLINFINLLSQQKNKLLKIILIGFSGFLIFYTIQFYFLSYYFRFPFVYSIPWRIADKKLALYLKENEKDYQKIVIDSTVDFMYTSLLFYTKYPGNEFLRTAKHTQDISGNLTKLESVGKYEFKKVDFGAVSRDAGILYVTNRDIRNFRIPFKKIIYAEKQHIVIPLNGQVVQYPITDIVYIMVDSKELRRLDKIL